MSADEPIGGHSTDTASSPSNITDPSAPTNVATSNLDSEHADASDHDHDLDRPTTSLRASPATLPSIHYPLTKRKLSIFRTWSLILLFSCFLPIVLYFALRYDTNLQLRWIFTIVTCLIGIIDVAPQLCMRAWLLLQADPFYRPLGSPRLGLDFFLWNMAGAFLVIAAELIVGTAPYHPFVRLLAMPAPSMLYWLGFQTLICTLMHTFNVKTPIRISSFGRGERTPPGLYIFIEDVVSVDGRAGRPYRQAVRDRFEASPLFRTMLIRLSFFWSVPAIALAAGLTAIIFAAPKDVGYAMGWSVPFAFGAVWTVITIFWVKKAITEEKAAWAREHDEPVDKELAV